MNSMDKYFRKFIIFSFDFALPYSCKQHIENMQELL